ncbi:MAG: hypothetical protein IIC67_04380 [Thaumarchaeota archaeon]|nr:hypothetical protein [Nitrososphaerota archaeon]
MLYQTYETEISQENLTSVLSQLPDPVCIIGGWAVYLTVNENFSKEYKRNYQGSKDIDLGFHTKDEKKDVLENGNFGITLKTLQELKFYPISGRFVKHYHTETRKELTEEEMKKTPAPFMFSLYIDPIVDNASKNAEEVLGFPPIDEPILEEVFERKRFHIVETLGFKVILPNPEVLLATKFNSVLDRDPTHKRIKDIADIFAIIWYSGKPREKLVKELLEIIPEKTVLAIISEFTDEDYKEVGNILEIEKEQISNVIKNFIPKNKVKAVSKDTEKTVEKDEKWRIPFNTNYEGFSVIVKALFQQNADKKPVSLDQLVTVTQMNKNTLGTNMLFLKSVKVIVIESKGTYKLTPFGAEFCKSYFADDLQLKKTKSKEMIDNSHLKSLLDFIQLKKEFEIKDLYGYIRAEGRFAEAGGITGITAPWSGGARILLRIFKDAGIISENFEIDPKVSLESKPRNSQTVKKKQQKKNVGEEPIPEIKEGYLGHVTVKGVSSVDINDLDTLDLAEAALRILRKKIESNLHQVKDSEEHE